MAKPFQLDIVSPEGMVWSGQAEFVVARTVEGEIGILADHEALMASLAEGEVVIDTVDEGRRKVDVDGGFLQVLDNQVTLITDRAKMEDSATGAGSRIG